MSHHSATVRSGFQFSSSHCFTSARTSSTLGSDTAFLPGARCEAPVLDGRQRTPTDNRLTLEPAARDTGAPAARERKEDAMTATIATSVLRHGPTAF